MMDVYIPPSMSYFVKKMSGVGLNTIRLTNLSNTTAACGDTIRVRLPSNSILDLSSFTMYMTATTTGNYTTFPKLTQSLIQSVRVNINGQTISGGSNNEYGVLYNIGSRLQQNAHHIKMLSLCHSGNDVATPTANMTSKQLVIDDWIGFMSSLPHYFHTGIVGECIIEIVLNQNNCLPASAASVACVLALSNIYFTMQVLTFDNDLYSKILETKLMNGETLEIAYTDAYSFFKPKSTTIEAQVSSNAITKCFVVPRVADTAQTTRRYTITNAPVLGVAQNELFDIGEGLYNDTEATISAACVTTFHNTAKTMQWAVDNKLIPANPATLPECYQGLLDMFGDRASTMASNSILQEPYELLPWTTVLPIPATGAAPPVARHIIIGTGATVSAGAEYTITSATTMAEAFPTDTMIYRALAPEYVYLRKNAIFGLNLEMNEAGDQRLVSGFTSIGKNCVIRCDLSKIIAGSLSAMVDLTMFVVVKKILKIRAGQQIFVEI